MKNVEERQREKTQVVTTRKKQTLGDDSSRISHFSMKLGARYPSRLTPHHPHGTRRGRRTDQ